MRDFSSPERLRFNRDRIELLGDTLLALADHPLLRSELYVTSLRTNRPIFESVIASLLEKGYVTVTEFSLRDSEYKHSKYNLTEPGRIAAEKYARLKSLI